MGLGWKSGTGLTLVLTLVTVIGCGGGGGGNPGPGPNPNPDPRVDLTLNLTSDTVTLYDRVMPLDFTAQAVPALDYTLNTVPYIVTVQYSTDAAVSWKSATELRSTGSGPQRGLIQTLSVGTTNRFKFFWDAEADLRPAGSENGPLQVAVRVTGSQSGGPGSGASSRIAFTVDWANTTGCVHTAPSIQVEREIDLTEGIRVNRALAEAGGDLPVIWSITPSLNNGLSLDPSGVLTGTPTASNADYFLKVSDTCSDHVRTDQQWVRIRVLPPTCSPLHFDVTASMAVATVGQDYIMNLAALLDHLGTGNLKWSLADGSHLPAGLTLNQSGTITGKAGAGTAGVYTVGIVVRDSCDTPQTESAQYSLVVSN